MTNYTNKELVKAIVKTYYYCQSANAWDNLKWASREGIFDNEMIEYSDEVEAQVDGNVGTASFIIDHFEEHFYNTLDDHLDDLIDEIVSDKVKEAA